MKEKIIQMYHDQMLPEEIAKILDIDLQTVKDIINKHYGQIDQ